MNARIEANTIIYTNENEVGEEEQSFESNTKHIRQLQKGSDAMIFYDGKRYEGTFADLDKKKMSYFAALTKAEALNKYGESGEDGAVEVFSKTEQELIEAEMQELTDELRNMQHEYRSEALMEESWSDYAKKRDDAMYRNQGKRDTDRNDLTDPAKLAAAGNPLILIDGKKYDQPFSTVDMKNYEFMSVYIPCEDTTKQYGEAAKDGVIDITMKEEKEFNPKYFIRELTRLATDYNQVPKKRGKQAVYQQTLGLWKYVEQFIPKHQKEITSICLRVMDEVHLFPFGYDMTENAEVKGIYELKPTAVEMFGIVEEMPRFPGCEAIDNKADREQCAQYELLQFVYDNIEYPKVTKDAGLEGMVVVRFSVDADGTVLDPGIVRSIDKHTDEEVLKMVRAMPDWIPGRQYGKAVRVQYNLPVKFKLEDDDQPKKEKTASLDHTLKTEHFKLYPNPVTDILNIELITISDEKTNIEILDSSGKNWKSSTLENTDQMTNTTFDTSQLPAGIYYLTVTQGNQKTSQSFVKE